MSLIKSYLHNKMTMTQDNIIDRDELQEAYVNAIVDGMDWKTMERFVYDTINENLEGYSVDELIAEVEEYNPDLLETENVTYSHGLSDQQIKDEFFKES